MYEDYLETFVGDTPVSVQINEALANVAAKNHTHDCVSREEFLALKKVVDQLIELVGDTPVSQQILEAMK